MIRVFFLIFLPFFGFCQDEAPYYLLDNQTLANEAHLAIDPFLILRTKNTERETPYNIEDSFQALVENRTCTLEKNCDYQESENLQIAITNTANFFDHETPYFNIWTNASCSDKIWWQISLDPDFSKVVPNFDQIEFSTPVVTVDLISETFLNPGHTYYFRAKVLSENNASAWSKAFPFLVGKPNQVQEIEFRKIASGKFEITWQKNHSPSTEYLIFGSNSQDFTPSIYYDKQVLGISNQREIETAPSYNLVAITPSNKIEVDGSLAYYRVIATDKNCYSVPSELIYVYDNDLYQLRNRLVLLNGEGIKRTCFHSCNPYLSITDLFKDYTSHPYISQETWNRVTPYLLPQNHPIKSVLDLMFSKKRISQSLSSLQEAGFKTKGGPDNHSKTIFCRHKNLKGSVVKIIPDEYHADEVTRLLGRIIGAATVQEIIDKYNYQKIIKVPRKWLYVLPPEPSPPPEFSRKNFILVADDMNIFAREENYPLWKSFLMTRERLHAIYTVITEGGFNDSVYAFNIPFAKDGKTAFIDTEDHHKWPIPYSLLRKYLSPELQLYWDQLTLPQ